MLTKLESMEIFTETEANKKFYPNSYIMVECVREGMVLKGRVAAYAPLNMSSTLLDYATELNKSGNFGRVIISDTKDPLDGGSLLGEIYFVKEK